MKDIKVSVSKPYTVTVGSGLMNEVGKRVRAVCKASGLVLVTDDIVNGLYGDTVCRQLEAEGFTVHRFVFPNGEQSKHIGTLSDILEFAAEHGLRRNDAMVALGGGVVGDMTGLAAALYMRGISFVQIPTTLLAMVDASIGGKTAIDLKAGKNLAGAFLQPLAVLCDTDVVRKLPRDIFTEGMAEVIKCDEIRHIGICEAVTDGRFDERLEEIITACIELKRDIVQEDEFETKGIRQLLNVGHTVAHGFEKLSGYRVSHGFAVGTGLVWEAFFAKERGLCDEATYQAVRKAVETAGLMLDLSYPAEDLIKAMKNDKKNTDDTVVFMLPEKLGKCVTVRLAAEEIKPLIARWEKQ